MRSWCWGGFVTELGMTMERVLPSAIMRVRAADVTAPVAVRFESWWITFLFLDTTKMFSLVLHRFLFCPQDAVNRPARGSA